MPIQKPTPHGRQHPDAHTQQRPLQERRRTMQTISELSVTDHVRNNFGALPPPGHGTRARYRKAPAAERKPQSLHKQRSLSRYRSSPAYLQVQALNSARPVLAKHSHSNTKQPALVSGTDMIQRGWTARKDRARGQREQMPSEANYSRNSSQHGWIGSNPSLPPQTPLLSGHTSQQSFESHTSRSHLLRHSRSASEYSQYSQTIDRRASFAGTTGSSCYYDTDNEPARRASAESSSKSPSCHDNASPRPHKSLSQGPITVVVTPAPLPKAYVARRQRYYSNPVNLHHGLVLQQLGTTPNASPGSSTRPSSLSPVPVDDISGTYQKRRQGVSRRSQLSPEKEHEISVQEARLAALAALTSSSRDTIHEGPASYTPRERFSQARTCSTSSSFSFHSLHSPPRASHLNPRSSSTGTHAPQLQTYEHPALEPRAVPKRESLIQWKAEREDAKIEFGSLRRAEMKERVRRANEQEQEKEKELVMLGKGSRKSVRIEGKRERGCFGGVFNMRRWGKRVGS